MEKLIAGVQSFYRNHYAENREFFERLAAKKQTPEALFITCADSRINPNLITGTEPGDLFLIRNAGNLVPPHGAGGGEAATIEYSLEVLGIRAIIICGHSQCGAIQALLGQQSLEHLPAVRRWCDHAEATRRIVQKKYAGQDITTFGAAAARENVLVQVDHLETHPAVAARLATGDVTIYGWYYDIGSGIVEQYDEQLGGFRPLVDVPFKASNHSPMANNTFHRKSTSTPLADAKRA
jgi:carbonic anhydrase